MAKLASCYDDVTSFIFAFLGFFTALLCGLLAWGDISGFTLIPWYAVFLIGGPLCAGYLVGYSLLYRKQTFIPMLWSALTLLAGLLIGNYMGALWVVRHAPETTTSSILISAAIHIAVALAVGLVGSYFGYLRRGKKDYDHRMGLLPKKDAQPPTMGE
jgi:hypothetical protein